VKTIRVLLADDRPEVLESVRQLICKNFEVVGTVEDGQQAVEAACRLDPDIVVIDISMPTMNGLETASFLHTSGNRALIVFLTIHEDSDYIAKAFSVGARGYVSKRHIATDLIPALEEVLQGHTFLSPSLSFPPCALRRSI